MVTFTGTFNINTNDIDFNCDSSKQFILCYYTASIIREGNSNDLDINETTDAANATVSITYNHDINVVAILITCAILTLTVNTDTNNYLIDINGDGDVNGHTLIHTHTGSIADVDITQSGVYDNMITLTTSGDNHDIDISQTD